MQENEDLEQVYLTHIKSSNSWNDGLAWVSSFAWNIIQIKCFCLINIFFGFVWQVLADTIFIILFFIILLFITIIVGIWIMQDLLFKLRISSGNKTESFSLIFFVCGQVTHHLGKPCRRPKNFTLLIIFRLMLIWQAKRSVVFISLMLVLFYHKK